VATHKGKSAAGGVLKTPKNGGNLQSHPPQGSIGKKGVVRGVVGGWAGTREKRALLKGLVAIKISGDRKVSKKKKPAEKKGKRRLWWGGARAWAKQSPLKKSNRCLKEINVFPCKKNKTNKNRSGQKGKAAEPDEVDGRKQKRGEAEK